MTLRQCLEKFSLKQLLENDSGDIITQIPSPIYLQISYNVSHGNLTSAVEVVISSLKLEVVKPCLCT